MPTGGELSISTEACFIDRERAHLLSNLRAGPHPLRIRAVLTDVGLPDMKGIDVVKVMRRLSPRLAVVYVTGRSESDPNLQVALEAPNTRLLTKPVSLEEIEAAVTQLAGRPLPEARATAEPV